jgi:hypothetical protein
VCGQGRRTARRPPSLLLTVTSFNPPGALRFWSPPLEIVSLPRNVLDFTPDEIRRAVDDKLAELDWHPKPAGENA